MKNGVRYLVALTPSILTLVVANVSVDMTVRYAF